MVSAQVGIMGAVTGLADGDFSLSDGHRSTSRMTAFPRLNLKSNLQECRTGQPSRQSSICGWNPEIVKVIKATSLSSINLKFGY